MRIVTREYVLRSGIANAAHAQPVIERTFRQKAAGKAVSAQEIAMIPERVEKGAFYSLPAYLTDAAVAGIKWTTHVRNVHTPNVPYTHPVIVLNDLASGKPVALVEGLLISGLRTGAVSATAVKYLADPRTESLLICGSGFQAEHQVRGVLPFLPELKELHIWSRNPAHAERFRHRLADELDTRRIRTRIHASLPAKLDFAPIVIAATSATEPYLYADHFVQGHLFINIGMRDIDTAAIERFDRIVCDDFQAGVMTSNQSLFHLARSNPAIGQRVVLLEERILDTVQVRQEADRKLMFNAFGLPIFDLALAHAVLERLQEAGLPVPDADMYGEG
jgi:ornithine cyclodeaminase